MFSVSSIFHVLCHVIYYIPPIHRVTLLGLFSCEMGWSSQRDHDCLWMPECVWWTHLINELPRDDIVKQFDMWISQLDDDDKDAAKAAVFDSDKDCITLVHCDWYRDIELALFAKLC